MESLFSDFFLATFFAGCIIIKEGGCMKKVIFILVILGLLGGMYFFISFDSSEKEEYTTLNINDERVLELYSLVNPSEYGVTMRDVYLKNTFSNEFILGTSIVAYLKDHSNESVISEENVNKYVHKIFGDVTFAHDSGYVVSSYLCAFRYDRTLHSYSYISDCEKSSNVKLLRKIVSARKSDTEYIITEKMIVVKSNLEEVKNSSSTLVTLEVYDSLEERNLLYETSYNWEREKDPLISLDDYIGDASTYEYHFSFDGENFVYKSLEKVD